MEVEARLIGRVIRAETNFSIIELARFAKVLEVHHSSNNLQYSFP